MLCQLHDLATPLCCSSLPPYTCQSHHRLNYIRRPNRPSQSNHVIAISVLHHHYLHPLRAITRLRFSYAS